MFRMFFSRFFIRFILFILSKKSVSPRFPEFEEIFELPAPKGVRVAKLTNPAGDVERREIDGFIVPGKWALDEIEIGGVPE